MMIPQPQHPATVTTYARFIEVTASLAGRDPTRLDPTRRDPDGDDEDDLVIFGELLLLRERFFRLLRLPVTAHNSLWLYDCAEAGLPIEIFLSDADHFLPASIVDDEGHLLSALAAYFTARDVSDPDTRVYDALAFLGAPYHRHNAAAVGAWLAGALPFVTLRAELGHELRTLDASIC